MNRRDLLKRLGLVPVIAAVPAVLREELEVFADVPFPYRGMEADFIVYGEASSFDITNEQIELLRIRTENAKEAMQRSLNESIFNG